MSTNAVRIFSLLHSSRLPRRPDGIQTADRNVVYKHEYKHFHPKSKLSILNPYPSSKFAGSRHNQRYGLRPGLLSADSWEEWSTTWKPGLLRTSENITWALTKHVNKPWSRNFIVLYLCVSPHPLSHYTIGVNTATEHVWIWKQVWQAMGIMAKDGNSERRDKN